MHHHAMPHDQHSRLTDRVRGRRPFTVGALLVVGGLALALTSADLRAQDDSPARVAMEDRGLAEAVAEVRAREAAVERLRSEFEAQRSGRDARPGELAEAERRLHEFELELAALRRDGGSAADLRRVERLVLRERQRLEEIRGPADGGGSRNRGRLERLLENELRLLRDAQARVDALRGRGSSRVPMDGQPVTVGIDTSDVDFVRSSDRAPPRTTDRVPDRLVVRDRMADRPAESDRARDAARGARGRRAGTDAEMERLELEIRELRQRWEASEATRDGAAMNEAERERVSEQLERARDRGEELMTELRIADRSGLGPRHRHVIELKEELAAAEIDIRNLQRRLSGRRGAGNRQEVAEQIEQRLARLDQMRARVAQAGSRRDQVGADRDRLANRVQQIETAVEELRDLLKRHRVDEHRVVRAMNEVDRRRATTPLPPPVDGPRDRDARAAVTPALRGQIAELRQKLDALSGENNALRQHSDALAKSLAEHERLRAELEQRGWTRHHPQAAGTTHSGGDVQALRAENASLRREADQLRQQLGELRAAYEHLRHGVHPR